ncbi:hypothetical protein [Niallia sp. Krafla_26]|uniref:hypothetical protein n=1 Tax=Niallia sp. Krafla_26 TaxID=3064703 RepID=UPI003D18714F
MKRLILFLVTVLVLYVIYYDLNHGTLPAVSIQQQVKETNHNDSDDLMPYFEHTVQNGDTVLSIIEGQLGGSIPVPISDVVSDFKTLNQDLTPQEIQSGKKYKFPDYQRVE